MNKKVKKRHIAIIKTLRRRCECGNKVTDHHWLCNKCWSQKAKIKFWNYKRETCKNNGEVILNETN